MKDVSTSFYKQKEAKKISGPGVAGALAAERHGAGEPKFFASFFQKRRFLRRHCEPVWQSISPVTLTKRDGLFRFARNDGVGRLARG
jgi:hypothetical protein